MKNLVEREFHSGVMSNWNADGDCVFFHIYSAAMIFFMLVLL
jgi:hypothetical protein